MPMPVVRFMSAGKRLMPIDTSPGPRKFHRVIASLGDSRLAIDEVIASARSTLCVFDASLERLGFGDPQRIARLRALLLAGREHRLRIVLRDLTYVERHGARLLALLRELPAAIGIHRATGEAVNASDAFVLADDHSVWRQFHVEHPRASVSLHSPADARPLVDRFHSIWALSEQAISSAPPMA